MDVRAQHILDRVAELEIGVTDNAGAGAHVAIKAAGRHRRHAVDEFGFPHRFESLRRIRTVHGSALQEHRRADVVTGIQVRQEFREQVAHAEADDGQDGAMVEEVLRAGYRWKGQVLRAAMVRVRG